MTETAQVTFAPTQNEWDAPAAVFRYRDGRVRVQRHLEPPPDLDLVAGWTTYPHAVILVDGEMTEFDRARQPAIDLREADPLRRMRG